MASTKLRDIRNDHLKPMVMSSAPPPPPVTSAPPVVAQETVAPAPIPTHTPVVPSQSAAHQGNPNWLAVGVFVAIFCVSGIGIYHYNKKQNQYEGYYAEDTQLPTASYPDHDIDEYDVAAAASADAAEAAAAAEEEATAQASEVTPENETVDSPLLTYGSNWTYKVVDYVQPKNSYDNVRLSVTQVTPDGYTMLKEWIGTNREPAVLQYDDHLNLQGGAIATYAPALSYYDFPLYPGKTWQRGSKIIGHKYGTSDYMSFEGQVIGWESVSSPEWSDITALKIQVEVRTFKDNVEIARELDVSWYEPEVGRAIKTLDYRWNEETQSYGEPTRLHYVTNYNRR